MKYNLAKNKLAIGTEEGFVCIFKVASDGLDFDKILDKQEGRVLSLDWHVDGNHILTGSTDTLRLWDVDSGQPLQRMSTGRLEKNLETTVWSVLMLDDFTAVSGDSRGKLSFWQSQTGTLLDSYQSHKADILTLASNPDQDVIYASGVDPTIVHFQPVFKANQRRKWMKSISRSVNSHDVHAMIALPGPVHRVVSVGVDGNLFVDNPRRKNLTRSYPPLAWGNQIALASDKQLIGLKYDQVIEIWSLGRYAQESNNDLDGMQRLKVTQEPEKLVEIQCPENESIHNFALAPNGKFLVYATQSKLRLLRLAFEPLQVAKVAISCEKVPHLMTFVDDSRLLLSDNSGRLSLFTLEDDCAKLKLSKDFPVPFSHLLSDGADLAIWADYQNNMAVFDLKSEKETVRLPKNAESCIACMSLHPKSKTLLVAYANHSFVEICTKTGKYTKFTNRLQDCANALPKEWRWKSNPTLGILFPQSHLSGMLSKKTDTILLYDCEMIAILDRNVLMNENQGLPQASKQAKNDSSKKVDEKSLSQSGVMRISHKFKHLLFMGTLKADSEDDLTCPLVAVEVKPNVFEGQLPPSIRKKKFGAM